ncbi:hypothetical protein B4U84_18405 [Westiellopsis prolifica IICB1]|nr:hypothetical protein B4U84_18405 [Westiellopsis prolifica IICB1]
MKTSSPLQLRLFHFNFDTNRGHWALGIGHWALWALVILLCLPAKSCPHSPFPLSPFPFPHFPHSPTSS